MLFGWTILHVPDVREAVAFYERAFGLTRRFVDDQGEFAEMETGTTVLAFSAHRLVERMGFENPGEGRPRGMEIAFVTRPSRWRRPIGKRSLPAPSRCRRPDASPGADRGLRA
ncbi:MAG TPA: VOC family protein [Geminicoccus sp.]|jgi:catechol 2,3-dioxygenase-like lactoylglutathione lyase family enzyme|uniref:VOC family protein n=1 Tax=Geminicoccus sp. TaxID=2024832 RepID=UPI002E34ABB6|nr:VOC family protein [Geminicoccus sp.]HEX2526130.1 VOC family protein [Geminicoccus sp.]